MISFNNNYYKQLAGVTKMDKLCLLLISLQKKTTTQYLKIQVLSAKTRKSMPHLVRLGN